MLENSENKPKTSDRKYYIFALKIAGDFGATIAVPVVILAIVGQKMDEKYSTRPLFLILGMAIAAIITARLIYKKSKRYGQEFQDLDKKK
jgi:F0F1-type ATP synthase assembly protein I